MKKPHSTSRHTGAFLAIACFAVACTMLSAVAAGAQVGAAGTSGGVAPPSSAPAGAPNSATTLPGKRSTPAPGVVTPSTTQPAPGTLTTTPANTTTPSVTPAPLGTTNCAPSTATGSCVPGTTPPPNGLNTPPSTAYPLNPPSGNGQPGS